MSQINNNQILKLTKSSLVYYNFTDVKLSDFQLFKSSIVQVFADYCEDPSYKVFMLYPKCVNIYDVTNDKTEINV